MRNDILSHGKHNLHIRSMHRAINNWQPPYFTISSGLSKTE